MANSAKQETLHALLVVFGQFALEIGLISGIQGVKLSLMTGAGNSNVINWFISGFDRQVYRVT